MRLFPKSLSGQLIVLLLLALLAAQLVSFAVYWMQHRATVRDVIRENILLRTASVVRLLEATPVQYHEQLVRTSSTGELRYWLSSDSALPVTAETTRNPLAEELAELLGSRAEVVLVSLEEAPRRGRSRERGWKERADRREMEWDDDDRHDDDDSGRWHRHLQWRTPRDVTWLAVSVKPKTGPWLNAVARGPRQHFGSFLSPVWSMSLAAIAISVVVVLVIRRITSPLQRLAGAAESFGRGENSEPVAEEGPEQVRSTIAAFNRMRARLSRFVEDRTRMLAAISHDLRTPVTTLRLRAEMIEDEETRIKIIDTLEEMQRMIEATLAFAREEAAKEDTRQVDVAALCHAVCDDLADLGHDVRYEGEGKLITRCRPVALKRALRNLIGNAVAYGTRAYVRTGTSPQAIVITIEDDGPGIPAERLEDVFKPFVRLEESRSRETGGAGLGLAIARSIVRGHGGDIVLENRAEGGLRVKMTLPRTAV